MNAYKDTIFQMYNNPYYRYNYMFYAGLASQCNVVYDNTHCAPAAVGFSGRSFNLIINLDKFLEYSEINRLAIIKHEMCHILFEHLKRFKNEMKTNHKAVNLATDCAINQHISSNDLPDNCITLEYISKLCGKPLRHLATADYYYNELIKCDLNDIPDIDNHEWENSNDYEDDNDVELSDYNFDKETKNIIQNSITESESKNCLPKIVKSTKYYSSMELDDSTMDWSNILKRFLDKSHGKKSTSKRRSRRLTDRLDVKGKTRNKKTDILVIVDVSGSMSNSALKVTLSEMLGIFKTKSIKNAHMIQVDSIAHEPEKLSNNLTFKRKSTGATYLTSGLKMAHKHKLDFSSVIVLTDGELSKNDIKSFLEYKCVWLIKNRNKLVKETYNDVQFKKFIKIFF